MRCEVGPHGDTVRDAAWIKAQFAWTLSNDIISTYKADIARQQRGQKKGPANKPKTVRERLPLQHDRPLRSPRRR